jgi:hypothetical protein
MPWIRWNVKPSHGTVPLRNFFQYLKLGPASHINDGEGPVLHISLNCGIIELASDQTLGVEDGVVRVDGHLKYVKIYIQISNRTSL